MHYAYHVLTSDFLLVWTSFLALVVVFGFWWSGEAVPMVPSAEEGASGQTTNSLRRFSVVDIVSAVALLSFVTFYIAMIFYKEDFAYYDDDMLTDFSVVGKSLMPPIWPGTGRFYPLSDQEFNILKFITRSPAGYHALVAIELVVLLVVLFLFLRGFKVRYRSLLLVAVLVAPSFLVPFTGFVYPERNVLFWLAIILLCLQGYSNTKSRTYFVGCLVATHVALYYKETVVLLVVGYAVSRILLQLYAGRHGRRHPWQDLARENSLSLGMLAVATVYVVLFLAAMLPHRKFSYIAEHHVALGSVLFAYLQTDWLPLILLLFFAVRLGRFVLSRVALDPLWDPLAVGALAYFFGVIAVKLNSAYYMAPVDLIALFYLARLSLVWLAKPTRARISIVAVVFTCVLFHDVAYSAFRIIERKELIISKSHLAQFLGGYLLTAHREKVELFFPYASGYNLMELSSYLKYKGFRLEGWSATGSSEGPELVIAGPGRFENNHCVEYNDYVCIHEQQAGDGALIVVLPDDDASMSDVQAIGKTSTLLLYDEAPLVCTRTGSWVRSLHAISPEFALRVLPEHWLELHVFQR
jgi:hypothetical protein